MKVSKERIQYIGVAAFVALIVNVTYRNSRTLSSNRSRSLVSGINEQDEKAPKLAWILAFPCTGSDYVVNTIHKLTGKTTATNYGHTYRERNGITKRDSYESTSVFNQRANGPWLYTDLPVPESSSPEDPAYLPVLSYCGGYCAKCFPGRYILKRDKFIEQCVTGTHFKPSNFNNGENEFGWTEERKYDGGMIKKAGIMIRDPIDVIESRFLYYSNVYAGELDWSQRYDQNRKGFLAYCAENQVKYADEEAKWWNEEVRMAGLDIPCYAEFYKLIQWHNLVDEMIEYLEMEYRYFYYETFTKRFVDQANNLLEFYNLEPTVDINESQATSTVKTSSTSLFTSEERAKIGQFIYKMASPKVKQLLSLYGLYVIQEE